MNYIGIDIGGTNLKAGLVDDEGNILAMEKRKIAEVSDQKALVEALVALTQSLTEQGGLTPEQIRSVGVGVPGAVEIHSGAVLYTCNLPLRNVPLRKLFHRYLPYPLYVENDANCAALAEYYAGADDGTLVPAGVARLSMTMAELSAGQVLSGTLRGGEPAVFATGVSDSRVQVTDILALRDGELGNLTVSDSTGVSREIYRYLGLFPTDIDGDGVTELPVPQDLLPSGDTESGCRIRWRSYDAAGTGEDALSTYHALADGWYLTLPESWGDALSVRTEGAGSDASLASFGIGTGDGRIEILRIYTFSGENRETLAAKGGRVLLSREGETIYSAELLEAGAFTLTEDALRQSFHRITRVWNLGGN